MASAAPEEAKAFSGEGHSLGTQKARKHKHFMGISLPYLGFIIRLRGLYGMSLSIVLLMCFFGTLILR